MFNFYQVHDPSDFSSIPNKTALLYELGRVVTSAYEQGITLEEVKAICGAAYGDWEEAQNVKEPKELFLTEDRVKGYSS